MKPTILYRASVWNRGRSAGRAHWCQELVGREAGAACKHWIVIPTGNRVIAWSEGTVAARQRTCQDRRYRP